MEIALIVLVVCNFGALVAVPFVLVALVRAEISRVRAEITTELGRLVAGEQCQSGAVLNAVAEHVGSRAGVAMKASLMADLSHITRAEGQTATDQTVAQVAAANPGIGAVLMGMGARGRGKMLNNPFIQLAMSALLGGPGGSPAPGPGPDNNHGSVRERLQKGG